MKPTIGRIVHYVDGTGNHCAAIINAAPYNPEMLNIAQLGPAGMTVFRPYPQPGQEVYGVSASYDEKAAPYTWHWPERE